MNHVSLAKIIIAGSESDCKFICGSAERTRYMSKAIITQPAEFKIFREDQRIKGQKQSYNLRERETPIAPVQ